MIPPLSFVYNPAAHFPLIVSLQTSWLWPLDRIMLDGLSVRQITGPNGGDPSATGGMCRHAEVALQVLGIGMVKDAEPVLFRESACAYDDFKDCVAQAVERRHFPVRFVCR